MTSTAFYLHQNLRVPGDQAAVSWHAVKLLEALEPTQLTEATVADLLYLVDYTYRLLIQVQDETTDLSDNPSFAWDKIFPEIGYDVREARRISRSERCAVVATRSSLFVDWVFERNFLAGTVPAGGAADYEESDFLAPGLFSFCSNDSIAVEHRQGVLVELVRLARLHADLLLVEQIAAHVPARIAGPEAAFLGRVCGNALALVSDRLPHLLVTLSPEARSGLEKVLSVYADRYLDDEKQKLYQHFGAEAFGKGLILVDQDAALAHAFLSLVLAFLRSADEGKRQSLVDAAEAYQQLFTRSRAPRGLDRGELEGLDNFVSVQQDLSGWPRSIPECESLARVIAAQFVLTRATIDGPCTGRAGEWNFFGTADSVLALRMPGDGAFPKASARLRNLISRSAGLHPLLNWLILPSTLQSGQLPSMYRDSHYFHANEVFLSLQEAGEAAQRLAVIRQELAGSAIVGASAGIGSALLTAILPDLPSAAYAGAGAMIASLAQKWAERRRRFPIER